jgi:hypothetical protein
MGLDCQCSHQTGNNNRPEIENPKPYEGGGSFFTEEWLPENLVMIAVTASLPPDRVLTCRSTPVAEPAAGSLDDQHFLLVEQAAQAKV